MNVNAETDTEGYLKDLADWTPVVAEQLALACEITLTEAHWEVIRVLRAFYQDTDVSPAMRPFVKLVREGLGQEKGNSIYLMQLFGESPAKTAALVAGLPKPSNCL